MGDSLFYLDNLLWKLINCLAFTLRGEIKKKHAQKSPLILDLRFWKTWTRKLKDKRYVIIFEKLRFQNAFRPRWNAKSALSNSSGLKSVFEKRRFRDGSVWTVSLTGEIKLRLQISPVRVDEA